MPTYVVNPNFKPLPRQDIKRKVPRNRAVLGRIRKTDHLVIPVHARQKLEVRAKRHAVFKGQPHGLQKGVTPPWLEAVVAQVNLLKVSRNARKSKTDKHSYPWGHYIILMLLVTLWQACGTATGGGNVTVSLATAPDGARCYVLTQDGHAFGGNCQ